ncbi:MAG TPA: NAD(P)-binding domain-containing protein [Polyangiaceae bacterium]|nr:NAD(P)-binding domain-containing protein [Polyangiaceae bacterium]
MIAFLGTGLLGSNFVRAMRRRGEEVQVWNRTAEKARALEADGARAFNSAAEAARGAARVHLTLSDDNAVDEVLEQARAAFGRDVMLVDHTTTSPTGTAARARRWAERGIAFQHAPVFMAPKNALEGTGLMLASGERARFDALAPELAKMTGKVVYLGPDPSRAAGFKLLGNLFLMSVTAGMSDMLALAKSLQIAPNEAGSLFDWFNPGATAGARLNRIIEADFSHPSWELAMARKDARLMMEEAERGGLPLAVIPAIAKEMDRWIEKGHGKDDWTVIAKAGIP